MSEKKKTKKIIGIGKISIFSFLPSIFVSFCLFFYLIKNFNISLFFIFSLFSLSFLFLSFYNYKKKRIIITESKIHFIKDKKPFFSVEFSVDFKIIQYTQSKIGKLFNYGTFFLVNQSDQMATIHYIDNPEKLYSKIEKAYNNLIEKEKELENEI